MLDEIKETYRTLKKIYFGSSVVGDIVGSYLIYTQVLPGHLISKAYEGIENLKYTLSNDSKAIDIVQTVINDLPSIALVTWLGLSVVGTIWLIFEGYKKATE